jgi:hypothetical protein
MVRKCELVVGLLNSGTVRGVGDLEYLVVGRHCLVEHVERRKRRGELGMRFCGAKAGESARVM